MSQILLFLTLLIFGAVTINAETNVNRELEEKIIQFVKAGDEQNPNLLDGVLHPDYRITFAFPGESKVSIVNHDLYRQMLSDKKLGGKKRTVKIEDISVRGNIAVVRIRMQSDVMKFSTFFSLINIGEGWRIIADLPYAEKI